MIWKDNSQLSKEEIREDQIEAIKTIINIPLKELIGKNSGLVIYPNKVRKETLDQFVIKGYYQNLDNMNIQTSNLIGVISVPVGEGCSQTIYIGSRFDNNEKQPFLIYLLSKVFGGLFIDWKTNNSQNDFFDILLILMFFDLLKKQARKGFPRFYISRHNNNYNLRGKLNLNEHIKLNVPFLGKVAYETREHSYDNNLMWLIRYTFERIKLKHRHLWEQTIGTDKSLRDISSFIEQVTPTYSPELFYRRFSEMNKPVSHPLYKDLEIIRKICLQIIRDEGLNIYGDTSKEVYGILFDVAWLWEVFLGNIIKEIKDRPFEHLIPGEQGIKVFKVEKSINFYPDFISFERKTVLDAKYKFWRENKDYDDIHQLLAYMFISGSNRGGVIFPSKSPSTYENEKFSLNTPYGFNEFVKISFSVPKTEEDEFIELMRKEEKVLLKKIEHLKP
ncbi:5-methylcytosine restriction system specificity protein McrC [Peribacillus frigoritolerans]|uniref:5-methylcytosine restriction system specificity protein McrC n=1 Tax=Peribacillus frigoritolerans TaxID=450367 RepID=UPI003F86FE80